MLTSIGDALDLCARYGIGGATLVRLAADPATADTANAAMGVFQAQYFLEQLVGRSSKC